MVVDTNTQRELDKFVERNVYLGQTALVERLLANSIIWEEDIHNGTVVDFDGETFPITEATKRLELLKASNPYDEQAEKIAEFEADLEDAHLAEIFEWYAVSDWLAERLLAKGEPIISNEYGTWWGRTVFGQAISMDGVIQEIYDETK